MKTRNGFVSNSSSSSFVVKYYDKPHGKSRQYHLDKSEISKLKKNGFKSTWRPTAHSYYMWGAMDEEEKKDEKQIDALADFLCIGLGKSVTCNQDDEIEFLLKNNISFIACCHYGDYHVFYKKNSKYFFKVKNVGNDAETWLKFISNSGPESIKKEYQDNWFEKIRIKKFLKRQEEWEKENAKWLKE